MTRCASLFSRADIGQSIAVEPLVHPTVFSDDPVSLGRGVRDAFAVAPEMNGAGNGAGDGIGNGSSHARKGGESKIAAGVLSECILLVEEDAATRDELEQMLAGLGYDVQIVLEAHSALELWRSCPVEARPHLILVDVAGGNGIELLRAVRLDDPHLPVVLMTAFPSQAPLIEALRLRADDVLAKPIAATELKNVLDRALETRRNRSECEQEAARAARLQAVLETAMAVNHEINNPLAAISASAQLLRHHLQLNGAAESIASDGIASDEAAIGDSAVMGHLLDVIVDQCERIACFNRKLNQVANPVTRLTGGQKMLDVDGSHSG